MDSQKPESSLSALTNLTAIADCSYHVCCAHSMRCLPGESVVVVPSFWRAICCSTRFAILVTFSSPDCYRANPSLMCAVTTMNMDFLEKMREVSNSVASKYATCSRGWWPHLHLFLRPVCSLRQHGLRVALDCGSRVARITPVLG